MTKIPVLFKLMEERNINQTKLSQDTKISTGNISDWKSGRSMPSSKKLEVLAEYFNVSINYLLGNYSDINARSEAEELYARYQNLSDEQRALIDNMFSQFEKNK